MLRMRAMCCGLSERAAATQVGTKLRGFGASLLSGTTGLLEKVHDTISAELEGMEGQLTGRGRGAPAPAAAARCGPHAAAAAPSRRRLTIAAGPRQVYYSICCSQHPLSGDICC